MFGWFRRRPAPAGPQYATETPEVQMKIIRTHMAAQAGELSTMNVRLGQLLARLEGIELMNVRLGQLLARLEGIEHECPPGLCLGIHDARYVREVNGKDPR